MNSHPFVENKLQGAGKSQQLKAAFPNGIDVYSDGIGGALTETVTAIMNHNSRLFSYGLAAAFYADKLDRLQQRPSLRQMFGISENVENILKRTSNPKHGSSTRSTMGD